MTADPVFFRAFIEGCQGMSHQENIAAYHPDYYDDPKPYIHRPFERLGIAEHEVLAWIQRQMK